MDHLPFVLVPRFLSLTRPNSKQQMRGWTLIELLTVVAITAILAAVTIPVVARALSWGQSARCMGNMRTIGVAVAAYSAENDGRFPRGGWADGGGTWNPPVKPPSTLGWLVDLWPYLGGNRNVFECPAAEDSPNGQTSWTYMPDASSTDPRYPMHYAYNAQLHSNRTLLRTKDVVVDRVSGVLRMSGLPVLMDIVFQNNFYGGIANLFDPQASQKNGTSFAARHQAKGHVLWGDGRVTAHSLKEWAQLPEERVPTGTIYDKRWQFCKGGY